MNRNTDSRTVIINVVSSGGGGACGRTIACVKSRDGSIFNYADAAGHMYNLEIVIEEPSSDYVESGGIAYYTRYIWTNDRNKHRKFAIGGKYVYLPAILIHEFGHAVGMDDLYKFGEYTGHIMYSPDKQTSIPNKDRDHLREVYRHHTTHPLPTP